MKAKIAYLTSPSAGVFVLNLQIEGSNDFSRIEISKAHLANIIIDGTSLALRETFCVDRVPETIPAESANERTISGS